MSQEKENLRKNKAIYICEGRYTLKGAFQEVQGVQQGQTQSA